MNPYTGDSSVEIGGKAITLRYDWAALSRIRAELGQDGQAAALAGDLDKLADLVAIGLAVHHPDMDTGAVRAASPAVFPTIRAVEAALSAAWFGPVGPEKDDQPTNPPEPPATRSSGLWRRLFGRG